MKRKDKQSTPLNLVIIGNGHYVTGETALSGNKATDKDFGVLFPSALYLRERGWVGRIALCGQDGSKFARIRDKVAPWHSEPGLDVAFESYPALGEIDSKSYLRALDEMPRPCAALIAVPDELHLEVMAACVERDIPFLVVKPAVTRLDDFYRIQSQLKGKDLLTMVDYHKVYDEANLLIRGDLAQGSYGRVLHISSLMSQRRDMIEIYQRWLRKNPHSNINHYLGSHYIHLTGFLTGAVPLDVRATAQYGYIQKEFGLDVADTIQTQIQWRSPQGYVFSSYHIAGWTDPSQTESMTYQEMHLMTENGHVFSDQRFRGTRIVLAGTGMQAPNPYFFNFAKSLLGGWNLETKYGYQSVKNFVELALADPGQRQGLQLPTFAESEHVTAILEAADLSLKERSAVVALERAGDRMVLGIK
jgi:D-galacturonate reductase